VCKLLGAFNASNQLSTKQMNQIPFSSRNYSTADDSCRTNKNTIKSELIEVGRKNTMKSSSKIKQQSD
jgi:hypothetical protein